MDGWKKDITEEVLDKTVSQVTDTVNEKGIGWISERPWLAPVISLIPFGGVYAYIAMQQWAKAGVLLLFLAYDIVPMLFIWPYIPFKLLIAYDTWVLAKRVQEGKELGHWEWFWTK